MADLTEDDKVAAYVANYAAQAILILVQCLKNQGALRERQYEDALRRTIEAAGAEAKRFDYVLLQELLALLEKQQSGAPPKIDAIH
jgi:hypothetical protein